MRPMVSYQFNHPLAMAGSVREHDCDREMVVYEFLQQITGQPIGQVEEIWMQILFMKNTGRQTAGQYIQSIRFRVQL